jgi:hypothetical protein
VQHCSQIQGSVEYSVVAMMVRARKVQAQQHNMRWYGMLFSTVDEMVNALCATQHAASTVVAALTTLPHSGACKVHS